MDTQTVTDRINLVYESRVGGRVEQVELPFKVLVLGDLTCDERSAYFGEQVPVRLVDSGIDVLFQQLKPGLVLSVEDCLSETGGELKIELEFRSLEDFAPASIMHSIPAIPALLEFNDSLSRLASGGSLETQAFDLELIEQALQAESVSIDEITANAAEYAWLISSIESRICRQLDVIIHHPDFRRLEAGWRSARFLIDRTDFGENCELAFLNVTKEALLDNFDDVPEVFQSLLYQHVYADEFGQFGGRPYGIIIGDYDFGPGARDIMLMQRIAAVSAVAHAPFIAAAAPEFFDIESYEKFSKLRDLQSIFAQPKYVKWRSFRATPDARYVGLAMPGFLLRKSYDVAIGSLQYREHIEDSARDLLWGNTGIAYATRLLASFARYRWCLNSTGNTDGRVEGLAIDKSSVSVGSGRIPTRFLLTDLRETEVVEQGFIPLSVHKGEDSAAFYSAYSVQSIKDVMEGDDDLSARLSAQLPYLLIVGRISHYLKVMQRENIGAWTNRREIDQHLNEWLRQYVSEMDNPAPGVRARRPLRKAEVRVREVEGKGDWYLTRISITPHLKYMGNVFSLGETGKLEKN